MPGAKVGFAETKRKSGRRELMPPFSRPPAGSRGAARKTLKRSAADLNPDDEPRGITSVGIKGEVGKTATEYDVRLQLVFGFGSKTARRILDRFSSPKEFFDYYDAHGEAAFPLSGVTKGRLERVSDRDVADVMNACDRLGISLLAYGEDKYPRRLAETDSPPSLLYIKGEFPDIDSECAVTVVGPRKVSDYGARSSFSISRRLAAAGCIILSGGAVGTDSAAHRGALSCGGRTVAVLGCGINYNYPKENEELREEISRSGCLISEYPPDHRPSKFTYPQRNRILSALGCGTVVIEAGKRSGTLITANCANEQGRDVFVIPGNPSDEHYEGSNLLFRDGARPLLSVADILEEYYPLFSSRIDLEKANDIRCSEADFVSAGLSLGVHTESAGRRSERTGKGKGTTSGAVGEDVGLSSAERSAPTVKPDEALISSLSEAARRIYLSDLGESFTADDAVDAAGCGAADSVSALTELEIMGLITALPGGRYKRL